MFRGIVFLAVLGTTCGLLLHSTDLLTAESIAKNREAAARLLVAELTGEAISQSVELDSNLNSNCPDWVLLEERVPGYAGPIDFLIFVEGNFLSARTKQHRETPGIGDFIDTQRDPYLKDLDTTSLEQWLSLDRVTGATVTSNALRRAVTRAFERTQLVCAEVNDE